MAEGEQMTLIHEVLVVLMTQGIEAALVMLILAVCFWGYKPPAE
jgi:hypothetical protein